MFLQYNTTIPILIQTLRPRRPLRRYAGLDLIPDIRGYALLMVYEREPKYPKDWSLVARLFPGPLPG